MTCHEWDYHTFPLPSQEYDMNNVSRELELPGAFLLGAAGAPSRILGMNAEVNHFLSPITPQVTTKTSPCRAVYVVPFPIPSDPRYKRDRSENFQNVIPFSRMCGYRVNIALKQGNLWVVVQLLAGVWTESCMFDKKGTRCSALKQLT